MYDIGYGVWEVFVEGVKQFCTYKYCIESEYGDRLMKADPYAFHAQTRPGQASVVYDIESYSGMTANGLINAKKTTFHRHR